MATVFLVLVVVLVLAALVFGVISMLSGDDPGLAPVEPDGRARPLPNNRSLSELDLKDVRFDLALRGYRMSQVDKVLRRTAYDLGYKDEMIAVLEAEVSALRDGRLEDAELLSKARESAANPTPPAMTGPSSFAPPADSLTVEPAGELTDDDLTDDSEPDDVLVSGPSEDAGPAHLHDGTEPAASGDPAPGDPATADPAQGGAGTAKGPGPKKAAKRPARKSAHA